MIQCKFRMKIQNKIQNGPSLTEQWSFVGLKAEMVQVKSQFLGDYF